MDISQQVTLQWPSLHGLIPSHFPPIDLFERVADPQDLDIVFAIEALTNDRLMSEVGDLSGILPEDRLSGRGSTPVMAAFTHTGQPNRFTDGRYGVYYGANSLGTAIAETVYHRELFLSATNQPDTEVTMGEYVGQVALPLHDVRGDDYQHLHDKDDYETSQIFAKKLRAQGSNGLLYNSVRYDKG